MVVPHFNKEIDRVNWAKQKVSGKPSIGKGEGIMQLAFYFNQNRCMGCYTCVIACKDWNDVPPGPAAWRKVVTLEGGKFPNPFAARLSTSCYHCAEPACVYVCPVDAISKERKTGS